MFQVRYLFDDDDDDDDQMRGYIEGEVARDYYGIHILRCSME